MSSLTDQWMKTAKNPDSGDAFIVSCLRMFGGKAGVHPKRVIQGVGSGLSLMGNAEKWSRPRVGPGADISQEARGEQWRLVMACAGLEVFAKALQGNFANQGGPGVQGLLARLGEYSAEEVALPACKTMPKGKTSEDLLDFLRPQKNDRSLLERWLSSAADPSPPHWQRSEATDLARIIRNLTAYGILSATLSTRLGMPKPCAELVHQISTIPTILIQISIKLN